MRLNRISFLLYASMRCSMCGRAWEHVIRQCKALLQRCSKLSRTWHSACEANTAKKHSEKTVQQLAPHLASCPVGAKQAVLRIAIRDDIECISLDRQCPSLIDRWSSHTTTAHLITVSYPDWAGLEAV